ncbi:phosphatidylserine decarboxylase family protein [Kitasatospora sp. NPDC091207]|uniref:phosphatidylserine decarboxylase family protein n=1 Tax=Kitasatospora sp. NPDC091207 TaxID=3364083 RepID=UPI0037F4E08F
MGDQEAVLDGQYDNLFARAAGYLPDSRAAIDEWQADFVLRLGDGGGEFSPGVRELEALIKRDGIVRMYVSQMIQEVPPPHQHIKGVDELLAALDLIRTTAPQYNPDREKRVFFPMSALFVYMMMTPAGEALFRNEKFNRAIQKILKEWCDYLDSDRSAGVLTEGEDGWLSAPAVNEFDLDEYVTEADKKKPHWGYTSFNAFFHRELLPGKRPVDTDPAAVVSANDGAVFRIARDVRETDDFWLKGQPYSLVDMLNGSPYTSRFLNGDVFQSFLAGSDYHRWRSPIDGVVRSAEVVDGLMFSNAESAGEDPTAGTYSQGYQASVNTRGLLFIESPDARIGMVCVIPIGITEISSVTIGVKPGQPVKKGDELGWFSYGGSSMCLVFEPGKVRFLDDLKPDRKIRVSARIATVGH